MHLPTHLPAPLIGVPAQLSKPPIPTPAFPFDPPSLTHSLAHPDNEINTYHHLNPHPSPPSKTHPPCPSAFTSSPSSQDVPTARPWGAGRPSPCHLCQRGASHPQDRGHYDDGRSWGVVAARGLGWWWLGGGLRLSLSPGRRWRRVRRGGSRRRGRIGGNWVSFFARGMVCQARANMVDYRIP
jgi:hypothetical protein